MNELLGGCLIAPAGQELRPTAATMQWAELVGSQEVSSQAWATLGISVSQQARPIILLMNIIPGRPFPSSTIVDIFRAAMTVTAYYRLLGMHDGGQILPVLLIATAACSL